MWRWCGYCLIANHFSIKFPDLEFWNLSSPFGSKNACNQLILFDEVQGHVEILKRGLSRLNSTVELKSVFIFLSLHFMTYHEQVNVSRFCMQLDRLNWLVNRFRVCKGGGFIELVETVRQVFTRDLCVYIQKRMNLCTWLLVYSP